MTEILTMLAVGVAVIYLTRALDFIFIRLGNALKTLTIYIAMTLLTREAITRKSKFEMIEVDVSEWGDIDPETGENERTTVFVRELSAREKGEFDSSRLTKKGKPDIDRMNENSKTFRERMAIATCCDADGNPIFQKDDIALLSQQPVKILDRILAAAIKINRLGEDYFEDDEAEEVVKN
ncbi:MAG: hypothetical protein FWE95_05295 [Planctomycetaceae bacterium]|nr:hypothetical protein [Planctomycetaceae bacterium]